MVSRMKTAPTTALSRNPPVQFEFVAVHVLKDGSPQEEHVVGAEFFAFDPGERQTTPRWSSVDTDYNAVRMFTGEYRHMQYVFTDPGQYLVQVHAKGHVRNTTEPAPAGGHDDDWSQISPDETITSPAEWYTFHVGPEADLGVTLTHTDETSEDKATTISDSTASFTVTATNGGLEAAKNAIVQVRLPRGLTYKAGSARVGSATTAPPSSVFNSGCGVMSWKIGAMAAPTPPATATTSTLTFTADVGASAGGRLTATAEIRNADRESFDFRPGNDTSPATVLRSSTTVRPPFFGGVTRDIVEHAIAGTHAGDPVTANNPDGRQLYYSLSGGCVDWFDVHERTGQIALKSGKSLDYRDQWEFPLNLSVKDKKDMNGAADDVIDDGEPVTIRVIDTPAGTVHPTVDFTTNPNFVMQGESTRVTAKVANLTADDGNPYYCRWTENRTGNVLAEIAMRTPADCNVLVSSDAIDIKTYTVDIKWLTGGITASTDVTWYEGPGP